MYVLAPVKFIFRIMCVTYAILSVVIAIICVLIKFSHMLYIIMLGTTIKLSSVVIECLIF